MQAPEGLYVEWCLQPDRRRGSMIPVSLLPSILKAQDAGYSSVYWFDAAASREVLAAKSSAGLSRYVVYTNRLVMDLDNGEEQLARAETKLRDLGLAYDVYSSGSKGYHIVVPHDHWYADRHVPYSQRVWVEALDVGADLSLYQHGRLLSLPGRVHPRTQKKKAKVKESAGRTLALTIVESPQPVFALLGESEFERFASALWRVLGLSVAEPPPGGRHTALWGAAKALAEAGLSFELTLELMERVNESWQHPKSPAEVEAAVKPSFRASRKSPAEVEAAVKPSFRASRKSPSPPSTSEP